MGKKTVVKRLYVINGGMLQTDQSRVAMETKITERWLTAPVPMYLIETENGVILFDAGCDPRAIQDPQSVWGSLANIFVPKLTEEDHPVRRLAEIGVSPQDVTHVVLSHLHFDHAGGVRFFPEAQVYVQKSEYRYAYYPDRYSGGYFRTDFDYPELKWKLIEGDKVLMPGVTMLLTNGHTPGHMSLVVDLPSGQTVILAADAIYMQENMDRELVSPGAWNPSLSYLSIRKLKVVAEREGGLLLPNHDLKVWETLVKAPKYYE
ncbi:MAG: N-acyl homoserine lactonase family protein [Bacillota bacterium]